MLAADHILSELIVNAAVMMYQAERVVCGQSAVAVKIRNGEVCVHGRIFPCHRLDNQMCIGDAVCRNDRVCEDVVAGVCIAGKIGSDRVSAECIQHDFRIAVFVGFDAGLLAVDQDFNPLDIIRIDRCRDIMECVEQDLRSLSNRLIVAVYAVKFSVHTVEIRADAVCGPFEDIAVADEETVIVRTGFVQRKFILVIECVTAAAIQTPDVPGIIL